MVQGKKNRIQTRDGEIENEKIIWSRPKKIISKAKFPRGTGKESNENVLR